MKNKIKYFFTAIVAIAAISYSIVNRKIFNFSKSLDQNLIPPGLVDNREKKWQTKEELKELFDKKGLSYSDYIVFVDDCKFLSNIEKSYLTFEVPVITCNPERSKYLKECVANCHSAPVYVKWVDDDIGYGVYAAEKIKKDDYIIEYTGMVTNKCDDTSYTWNYPCCPGGFGPLNLKFMIDGNFLGNIARFVNDPMNDEIVNVGLGMVYEGSQYHIVYLAYKDIEKDEQLFVSYGSGYWEKRPYGKKIEK